MSITLGIFAVILAITLTITYWAARRTSTTSEFYAAANKLTAAQNGFALAGDWCSAAAFLGFSGLTALYGVDGALYALGPLMAFCTVLFLIAEPLRNSGKYTLGDVIRARMQTRTSLPGGDKRHDRCQLRLSHAANGWRGRTRKASNWNLL